MLLVSIGLKLTEKKLTAPPHLDFFILFIATSFEILPKYSA